MVGYNPDFLGDGFKVPMPTFRPELVGDILSASGLASKDDGNQALGNIYADYPNYTIVTNRARRQPILAALNIDQKKIFQVPRRDRWRTDSRIGREFQLDNDYYRSNPWDRGHLARRSSAAWGVDFRAAQVASDETFYYSNASLQHENFNQDEWLALEDWVAELTIDLTDRIVSFSGPIYSDTGRAIRPVGRVAADIPSAFFKVVCFVNAQKELDVRAFVMYQDSDLLRDKFGRRFFNYQTYQVTISDIEDLTGLEFDDSVYQANPLFFSLAPDSARRGELNIASTPERIEVTDRSELIGHNEPRDFVADDLLDVFIAAAVVNPKGDERKNEWVSIINLSNESVDLDGWILCDQKQRRLELNKVIDENKLGLEPGESVRVQPLGNVMLANSGGAISLYEAPKPGETKGRRIDRVHYTRQDAREEGRALTFLNRT